MTAAALAREFLKFNNACPSPFHVVHEVSARLQASGFQRLKESEDWNLKPMGKYFFTRNSSTLFAFVVGGNYRLGNGLNIVGAHTDSPCPKLKPHSGNANQGFLRVGVQLYGGGLWHTWMDRDLSVAGRVVLRKSDDVFETALVKIERPILRIPNLAIHLQSQKERDALELNKQTHVHPVLATILKSELEGCKKAKDDEAHHPLLLKLLAAELKCSEDSIHDFELSVFDTAPGTIGGACDEFVFAARLDNLHSSWCAIEGLIAASSGGGVEAESRINTVMLFDNEEVGSESAYGAGSNMVETFMRRINASVAAPAGNVKNSPVEVALRRSFFVSCDMAHACHPNYDSKHDSEHRPRLHEGVVIKQNANQRYATTSVTAFLIKELARQAKVPMQEFVVRNDSPCGSTIGPIVSSGAGMRTVDIGAAQLSMHSVREMASVDDVAHTVSLLTAFFAHFTAVDEKLLVD